MPPPYTVGHTGLYGLSPAHTSMIDAQDAFMSLQVVA
jgi:hypothetical protein